MKALWIESSLNEAQYWMFGIIDEIRGSAKTFVTLWKRECLALDRREAAFWVEFLGAGVITSKENLLCM